MAIWRTNRNGATISFAITNTTQLSVTFGDSFKLFTTDPITAASYTYVPGKLGYRIYPTNQQATAPGFTFISAVDSYPLVSNGSTQLNAATTYICEMYVAQLPSYYLGTQLVRNVERFRERPNDPTSPWVVGSFMEIENVSASPTASLTSPTWDIEDTCNILLIGDDLFDGAVPVAPGLNDVDRNTPIADPGIRASYGYLIAERIAQQVNKRPIVQFSTGPRAAVVNLTESSFPRQTASGVIYQTLADYLNGQGILQTTGETVITEPQDSYAGWVLNLVTNKTGVRIQDPEYTPDVVVCCMGASERFFENALDPNWTAEVRAGMAQVFDGMYSRWGNSNTTFYFFLPHLNDQPISTALRQGIESVVSTRSVSTDRYSIFDTSVYATAQNGPWGRLPSLVQHDLIYSNILPEVNLQLDEMPTFAMAIDPTVGMYLQSMRFTKKVWSFDPIAIWRCVLWDINTDQYTVVDSSSITWTLAVTTGSVTTRTYSGSITVSGKVFNAELILEEDPAVYDGEVRFSNRVWGPTGETTLAIVSTEFPRVRLKPPGEAGNLTFLNSIWTGYLINEPTRISNQNENGHHNITTAPPSIQMWAVYDTATKQGLYIRQDDTAFRYKQLVYRGNGSNFEMSWAHYPTNNFTPGQYRSASKYTTPYKCGFSNLTINGPGHTGFWDAAVRYRTWVETYNAASLPLKWVVDPNISTQTKNEKIFLVLAPSNGLAASTPNPAYSFTGVPAANFFPVFYEMTRTQQVFNDANIRVHVYEWTKNNFDWASVTNPLPPRPKPDTHYTTGQYDFTYEPSAATTYYGTSDNISFLEMFGHLGYTYSASPSSAPKVFPYLITPYWDVPDSVQLTFNKAPYGNSLVTWSDGSALGFSATGYQFSSGGAAVDLTLPANNYLIEKQKTATGPRRLLSANKYTGPALVPGRVEGSDISGGAALIYGVDFNQSAGRNLIVDYVKRVFDYIRTAPSSIGGATPLVPAGYYLDQVVGTGTTYDPVSADCYVLNLDRKNAVVGTYGNTGGFSTGKGTALASMRATTRATTAGFTFSAEACEEAALGKLDVMHAGGDFSTIVGFACYTFPIIYGQYQRLANLAIQFDPADSGTVPQASAKITGGSFHRGYPLSWGFGFSAALNEPYLELYHRKHLMDYATAPVTGSGYYVTPTIENNNKHIVSTRTTLNLTPQGILVNWLKILRESMSFVDTYRRGEMLRPLPGSADLRRIQSRMKEVDFYSSDPYFGSFMQSAWRDPATGNIGIIITMAFPAWTLPFTIKIDNEGWPLPAGTKYLYRNDGVTRTMIHSFTGNSLEYPVQVTGQAVILYEISATGP